MSAKKVDQPTAYVVRNIFSAITFLHIYGYHLFLCKQMTTTYSKLLTFNYILDIYFMII